jgi:hypothetical protein
MNKFIFLFSFFFLGITHVFAQEASADLILNSDNAYSYEKVFEVQGKNKEEIFKALKSWVIKNVKSQSNTNFDEAEKANITTNPAFSCSYGSIVDFKLNFEIKDGKYRLTANSFIWHRNDGNDKKLGDFSGLGMFKGAQKKVLEDANESFAAILTSIEASVKKSSDW